MRIALFSETCLPQRNGVAHILDRLVRYLAEGGHDVLVATADAPPPEGSSASASTRPPPSYPGSAAHAILAEAARGNEDGTAASHSRVRIVKVPGPRLPRYPDLTMARPFARVVSEAVRDFRPDVIHLVTEFAMGLTGLRIARKLGVPMVSSYHTNVPGVLPYFGAGWLVGPVWRYLRWFHGNAAMTFCPSEHAAEELRGHGFENVRLWSHGVETERFHPRFRVRGADGAPVRLLYVGRISKEKDLPLLFDAYRAVHAARPGRVHLTVTGDGSKAADVFGTAPPEVELTGYLDGDALARIYASADVFVFPSRVETQGNVVLEAMASGLPVIGVAEGGVLENIIDGENGLLCEPGNAESLARGMLRLVDDRELRSKLGTSARAWAEKRDWAVTTEPLLEAYREVIERDAKRSATPLVGPSASRD
jgi:phosphatidylinositol alpha 1,6-mannosyltransferase